VRRYVEDLAFVIDGTLQVHALAGDGNDHLASRPREFHPQALLGLEIREARVSYGANRVLNCVSLSAAGGEAHGASRSTLLRTIGTDYPLEPDSNLCSQSRERGPSDRERAGGEQVSS
jgi:hypothetical protein